MSSGPSRLGFSSRPPFTSPNLLLCNYFHRCLSGLACDFSTPSFLIEIEELKEEPSSCVPSASVANSFCVNDTDLWSLGSSSKPMLVHSFQNLTLLFSYVFLMHSEVQLCKNVFMLRGVFKMEICTL